MCVNETPKIVSEDVYPKPSTKANFVLFSLCLVGLSASLNGNQGVLRRLLGASKKLRKVACKEVEKQHNNFIQQGKSNGNKAASEWGLPVLEVAPSTPQPASRMVHSPCWRLWVS